MPSTARRWQRTPERPGKGPPGCERAAERPAGAAGAAAPGAGGAVPGRRRPRRVRGSDGSPGIHAARAMCDRCHCGSRRGNGPRLASWPRWSRPRSGAGVGSTDQRQASRPGVQSTRSAAPQSRTADPAAACGGALLHRCGPPSGAADTGSRGAERREQAAPACRTGRARCPGIAAGRAPRPPLPDPDAPRLSACRRRPAIAPPHRTGAPADGTESRSGGPDRDSAGGREAGQAP